MHRQSDRGPDQVPLESKDPFLDHLNALCHGGQSKNRSIESLVAASELAGFLETNQETETFEAVPLDGPADRFAAKDLKVLKEVGEYQLGKQIGKGGSSQVFEALRKGSKRKRGPNSIKTSKYRRIDRLWTDKGWDLLPRDASDRRR
jgi:hypothetical protein